MDTADQSAQVSVSYIDLLGPDVCIVGRVTVWPRPGVSSVAVPTATFLHGRLYDQKRVHGVDICWWKYNRNFRSIVSLESRGL